MRVCEVETEFLNIMQTSIDLSGCTVEGMSRLCPLENGSWVGNQLETWMSVCVCSVCRYQPCDGLTLRPKSSTDCVQD
jgi:hypothetical protein